MLLLCESPGNNPGLRCYFCTIVALRAFASTNSAVAVGSRPQIVVVLLPPHSRAPTPYGPGAASPLTGLGLLTGVLPAFCSLVAVVAVREARAVFENLNFLVAKKILARELPAKIDALLCC